MPRLSPALAFGVVPALIWVAALPAAAQTPPSTAVLLGARIASSRSLDVTVAPAAVTMEIKASAPVGLSLVRFALRSPSGHQTITGQQRFTMLSPEPTSFDGMVQTVFGGGGLGAHGLNLYSEPGTWTLSSVEVCDGFLKCATTQGASLAGMVSPLTVTVANPGAPATKLPVVSTATILTPSLQQTSPFPGAYTVPAFRLSLSASDAGPGIVQAQAVFSAPTTPPFPVNFCLGRATVMLRLPDLGAPATTLAGNLAGPAMSCSNATSLPGTYTLQRLIVADEAGNVLEVRDPAKLGALFPGGTTVTVSQ